MADKYLNKTGLQYFFNRIKTIFAEKSEITITTVKRNGSALTPDANKAVNVSVPITGIKRNGTTVNPSSYVVDISVPTTVAELSDATSYALKTDLSSKIDVFGTEIPASSNLNNYVTSGQFWCTQANASGLTNSPTTKPFVLWVARADSDDTSTRTVQLVYELNTPFRLYVRGCVSNTWRDWENIAYIDDVPTTVAELTDASTYAKKTDVTI